MTKNENQVIRKDPKKVQFRLTAAETDEEDGVIMLHVHAYDYDTWVNSEEAESIQETEAMGFVRAFLVPGYGGDTLFSILDAISHDGMECANLLLQLEEKGELSWGAGYPILYIEKVQVTAAARKSGIGSGMMQHLEKFWNTFSVHIAILCSSASSPSDQKALNRFYRRLGYDLRVLRGSTYFLKVREY